MTDAERIAAVARRMFRQQKLTGRERFGNTNATFANALVPVIAGAMLAGLKAGGGKGQLADSAASLVRGRALMTARSVNDTTAQWLGEGRDDRDVFGPDRAVMIGLTEASWAKGQGLLLAVKASKGKLKWVAKGPNICKECKSINGQVRKAGTKFKGRSGNQYEHPPVHPSCFCVVEPV